ncbi:bifunctional diaminohydroxyphosphoribosylaminopyrimidine deaminase/5-amino-6-(5-phosphoribosylamino)uracil reductase RibD [Gelidibacter sp. F63206]|uniref:bifunctional diaminohydroxyphosphoribosylaminopyrimidine deaminase/5-amino-6-(5-phosphoribosylamino)uracil reductase RibD n=1 Tax=Gelidibacter sp. F63206 TaxID=2926425 RepID=UPI001FF54333|nr:bifunctional diaminohydroxyphosphoribosylaminopyrimidine deaminase/5-amino-6-(5-phosphoribosylamino)uracil reductase RibD [Gelidibacter sp. F63206]MCK0115225.1 bifunctional diaminohydroxyphosphoribosylaminopyrimidine deaminase/5-amino-6-(5-phosphoribosylamino)uracil reductase RibD [Gelidibacter sp. F63206]
MNIHEKYIKRCIEIGKNGLGTTAPNPMVGCVIVHGQMIIGEGFTSPYGGAHAEVNAINSVKNPSLLPKSTLYVTLEPCSHFGKTPPCTNAIIKFKIPKVVIGTTDTHSAVAGKGIEKLKASGCEIIVGVLEDEVKAHHKRFFTFHNKKRPYIILKWAETADGFIAPSSRDEQKPVWITNQSSRQLVHKWRAEEQAILVGTNTVIEDNPSLTTRDWYGRNPIRIVLDKNSRLSIDVAVFDAKAKTIRISEKQEECITETEPDNLELTCQSVITEYLKWDFKDKIAHQICTILFKHDINSVIIEGGRQTLQTFIDENCWDEARVFKSTANFITGTKAPHISGRLLSEEKIINDTLKLYTND